MEIQSSTKGKLSKIINGVVFSDPYVFVTEFLQNCSRAKATRLEVTLDKEEGIVTFYDNGIGLKNPEDLFVLDYSGWKNLDEGFGIGFWSWLGFDSRNEEGELNEVSCVVKSRNFIAQMSKIEIFNADRPSAETMDSHEYVDGFSVSMQSELLKKPDIAQAILKRIRDDGAYVNFDVFVNGFMVPKTNIFASVSGDFIQEFDTRYFFAKFSVDTQRWAEIQIFYDNRLVKSEIFSGYASGVIELKPKALNLREPDRRDFSRDEKWMAMRSRVRGCVRDMYLSFLKGATQRQIDNYADAISSYLETRQYESILDLAGAVFGKIPSFKKSAKNETVDHSDDEQNESIQFENAQEKQAEQQEEQRGKTGLYFEENKSISQNLLPDKESAVAKKQEFKKNGSKLKDALRNIKKRVWVRLNEIDELGDFISTAKYYGVVVFVAKNTLYERVYINKGIPHILELKDGIQQRFDFKNIFSKTKKEEHFIQFLVPICKKYGLPLDTFHIADLELLTETKLDGKTIYRERISNKKNDIKLFGVMSGNRIYLDRHAMSLRKFIFQQNAPGKGEYKAIVENIDTISHELAHLIYGTTDNTIEHFKAQIQLQNEILALYHDIF